MRADKEEFPIQYLKYMGELTDPDYKYWMKPEHKKQFLASQELYSKAHGSLARKLDFTRSERFDKLLKNLLKDKRIEIKLLSFRDENSVDSLLDAVEHFNLHNFNYPEVWIDKGSEGSKVTGIVLKEGYKDYHLEFAKKASQVFNVPIINAVMQRF